MPGIPYKIKSIVARKLEGVNHFHYYLCRQLKDGGMEIFMIITRTPFRVSFCGGGSDLPEFYERYGGCVLSTTIKKYMYLTLHDYFYTDQIVLKYSQIETVTDYSQIKHSIFKRCLMDFNIKGVEISSMADIPAGTGLGSSSAFTVALLHLLYTYRDEHISKYKLAKEACTIEIEKLGEKVGKQDQFASSFGGLNFYEFLPNGNVNIEPVIMNKDSYRKLEKSILLFYIGGTHSASEILKEQSQNYKISPKASIQRKMCDITRILKNELHKNNLDAMGELLHENWLLKKSLVSGISNTFIDGVYKKAINAGALGGKLLGAGGAGFMLFYVPEEKQASVKTALCNFKKLDFRMDFSGSSIVYRDEGFI